MATAARVSLRAPPHLPFVQGWPGIPGDGRGRKQPAVEGTVEVRVGNAPVKAKWVRVELRKYEALPTTVSQGQSMWTHVGQICDLWKVAEGKDWELLQTADYKFHLPLPENLTPSLELPKGGGVRYELVAAICYRQKGGLLKKESAPIMKTTEAVRILKHELHSAWPLYLVPDTRTAVKDGLHISVHRPNTAFGPTDRLVLSASVRSDRVGVVRLQGFLAQMLEITTFNVPPAKRMKATTSTRTRSIAEVRVPVNEMIGQGQDKVRRMALEIPADGLLTTTNNAKLVEVQYELTVKAILENSEEVKVERLRYVVGVFPHSLSIQVVRDIGHFAALCPGVQPPQPMTPTGSIHSYNQQQQQPSPTPSQQPMWAHQNGNPAVRPMSVGPMHARPPVEPFPEQQWRRPSSTGSTVTTQTTQTHRQSMDFSPAPVDRPYSTVGTSSPSNPATYQPGLASRSQSYTSVPARDDESAKRLSGHTFGTAGVNRSAVSRPSSDAGTDMSGTGAGDNESFISTTSSHPQKRFSVVNADPKPRIPRARHSTGGSAGPSSFAFPTPSPAARPWESAESEKARLFAEARLRAAQTQQDSGASLANIGLDEAIPAVPPPEYAPQASFPVPLPASSSSSTSQEFPPSLPKAYLSAADEKEQQRLRFEQAQRRTVSSVRPSGLEAVGESDRELSQPHSPGSGYPLASGSGNGLLPSAWSHAQLSPKPPVFETAAQEKERMRYQMAIENREQYASDGTGSNSAAPSSAIPSYAQDTSNGSDNYRMATSSSQPPLAQTNAQDEKEQMRRYHEARDRVASGSASSSQGFASTGPSDVGHAASSSASRSGPSYPSAEQEKDMMRRRYEEATQAVTQRHSRTSSIENHDPQRGQALATDYMSAEQEKERMRRRFEEATLAVNSRSSMSPPASPAPESSRSGRLAQAYMSAEEEKDTMRQRYAQATGERDTGSPSTGPPRSASSTTFALLSQPFPSADQEKDLMRQRYEIATSGVSQRSEPSPHRHDAYAAESYHAAQHGSGGIAGGFHHGSRGMSQQQTAFRPSELPAADAPPPPLPTRPPAEYINLLSPVEASNGDIPPWSGGYAGINQAMTASQQVDYEPSRHGSSC